MSVCRSCRITPVDQRRRETGRDIEAVVEMAQQHNAAVTGDFAALEINGDWLWHNK